MSEPLEVALDAARGAGQLLVAGYGRVPNVVTKRAATDLLTEYDQKAEALVVGRLRAAFPDDAVLAEEGGLSAPARSARRWLVDPLDGTTNFAHGLPAFCVSIALEIDGVIEVGVVHAPVLELTFAARRGAGATCNGTPIHVSDEKNLGRALLATGFPYDRQTSAENNFDQFIAFQKRAQGVRRFGAAALDLAWVAYGRFDGYWEMKLQPWDIAAGALLVAEAGGRVTGWRGEPLSLSRCAVVASNGALHDQMLSTLAMLDFPTAAR